MQHRNTELCYLFYSMVRFGGRENVRGEFTNKQKKTQEGRVEQNRKKAGRTKSFNCSFSLFLFFYAEESIEQASKNNQQR